MAGGAALFIVGIDTVGGVWFAFIGFFLAQAARRGDRAGEFSDRIGDIRVSDVMDAEPVAIPQTLTLDEADAEYFLRYGWPWFPVVDPTAGSWAWSSREALDSVPGASARRAPGGHGDGARRRLERPARPARGSARDAAPPSRCRGSAR